MSDFPVDLDALAQWMDDQGLENGPIVDAEILAGGTQNILVRFTRGSRQFVLRRPPLNKRPRSDETMRREARVLAAIANSGVPHPRLIASEPDETVLGAAFYLMEPVEGANITVDGLSPVQSESPEQRRAMGLSLVDAIVALGAVDHEKVGLSDFGRPDGYLERQVDRWRSQLDSYSSFEGYTGPDIPHVKELGDWLDANRPSTFQPGIIHGDFHLANVMYYRDVPAIAAVVDWELSTIGDPLLDLGWLMATWPDERGAGMTMAAIEPWAGFPTIDELIEHYGQGSHRDLTDIAWYGVLACYKMGIILEGTNARADAGLAPRDVGDMLHATTVGLFERGARMIESSAR